MLGLGAATVSLLGLPIQHWASRRAPDTSFAQLRELAQLEDRGVHFLDAFPAFWWRYGLLIAIGVLVVLIGALVARPVGRAVGIAVALAAVGLGAAHAVALDQSPDYRSLVIVGRPSGTLFQHSALGPWIGFGGLVLVAIAGLLVPSARRRS